MQAATLLLNASYEPLEVIHWQRAIRLLWLGRVEVLAEYDSEIRAVSITIKMPSVIRLLRYVRRRAPKVTFNRANILARDGHKCQYCGGKFRSQDLTFDHVVPRSRGGATIWANIVTACVPCNRRKEDRTPREAGIRLLKEPIEPHWVPIFTLRLSLASLPDAWRDYVYWEGELDAGGK